MDTNTSTSEENRPVEFYVPGTFQFSTEPGRIERFLTRLFHRARVYARPVNGPGGPVLPPADTSHVARRG